MDDSERQALVAELNRLSEFEEQNLERTKEIAHVLVVNYMHKDDNRASNRKNLSRKDR